MNRIWVLTVFFFLVLGVSMPSQSTEKKRVAFRPVPGPEQWAPGSEPSYLVITEKNWSTHFSSPPQGSDFAKNLYIVASLGMKPNPGYTIKILQIHQEGERVEVRMELGEPDPQKFYAQIIVHPIAVAEVPKANLRPANSLTFVFLDQKRKQVASIKTEI